MTWNIDYLIFFSFLVLNIVLGLASSKGTHTIEQFAISDRKFSTSTLVSTLIATWICGEFFFSVVSETYKNGLYCILCTLCNVLSFIITAYIFIPRMRVFLGKISIAEAMGELYGQKTRLCTSVAGFICVVGVIAVQLKIAGIVFEYVLNINSIYGIIISGIIVTIYSSLGGIKSVTFTDVLQFFTFGMIIPIITLYFFVNARETQGNLYDFFTSHVNYNLNDVFDMTKSKFWSYLFLSFYMAIPAFNPAIFQRIAMAQSVTQAQKSFKYLALAVFMLTLAVAWLGVVLDYGNPGKNYSINEIFYTLFNMTTPGFRGFLLIGIIAMVMSTVDSYINSSSILITHDFINVFIKLKNELKIARIISFLLGISGMILAFKEIGLFALILATSSFYMATVTVPFMLAVFNYKAREKAVLSGMGAGITVVLIWQYLGITVIDPVLIAMLVNLVVLLLVQYNLSGSFSCYNNYSDKQKAL